MTFIYISNRLAVIATDELWLHLTLVLSAPTLHDFAQGFLVLKILGVGGPIYQKISCLCFTPERLET